ncbi:MAG: hypothetical protein M1834_004556 [Cirrosporium novae-zelandiae]|nr:MAG: hypothetical protein M1834_004556 [Cirrosporium novae-zelandiae]
MKTFITGATGYIGGDALYALLKAHPEAESDITALVRNSDKGALIAAKYPKINLVYGDLNSADLLEEEAKKADAIFHFADADHEGAAEALAKGLAAHTEEHPGFLVHTSGTGLLMTGDVERKVFGGTSTKIYNDWDGLSEVTSLPDYAFHRITDKIILAAGTSKPGAAKTAIVCPPTIYGLGRGIGNKRSAQVYELIKGTFQVKHGIQIGEGKAIMDDIHVYDLSDLYVRFYEAATEGGGKATWGKDGYYFVENGEHVWGEVAKKVANIAHKKGLIPTAEVKVVPDDEANKISPGGHVLWGANSRGKALRARKLLGWEAKERNLNDELPDAVTQEAERLGLIQGHAAKAAGTA